MAFAVDRKTIAKCQTIQMFKFKRLHSQVGKKKNLAPISVSAKYVKTHPSRGTSARIVMLNSDPRDIVIFLPYAHIRILNCVMNMLPSLCPI